MLFSQHFEVRGLFRLVVRKETDDSEVLDTGWFENLITNSGMNAIAASSVMNGATVGSGTTPESVNDVALSNYVARTSDWAPSGQPTVSIGSAVSPYYQKCVATWRFPVGAATGNLSEVGVIHTFTAPANWPLWSRTLIKDSSGSPITITVLADEYLDVMYEARVYPQDVISGGNVNLMGNSYAFKVGGRAINTLDFGYIFTYGIHYINSPYTQASTGPLSASPVNGTTGTQLVRNTVGISRAAYTVNSFTLGAIFKLSAGAGTGAIRSLNMATSGSFGPSYAVEFTPAFEKAATVELTTVINVTWARRTV